MRRIIPILLLIPFLMGADQASRSFDGTDDFYTYGNVSNITTGDATVCTWAKHTEDASNDALLSKKSTNAAGTAGWMFRSNITDLQRFITSDATTQQEGASTVDSDGVWINFCGTWDGTNDDVVLIENQTSYTGLSSGVGSLTNAIDLKYGERGDGGDDFSGLAFHAAKWSRVLVAWEIAEIQYRPNIIVDGLQLLSIFWDSVSVADLSGNGLTATLSGTDTASSDGPPVFFGGLPL